MSERAAKQPEASRASAAALDEEPPLDLAQSGRVLRRKIAMRSASEPEGEAESPAREEGAAVDQDESTESSEAEAKTESSEASEPTRVDAKTARRKLRRRVYRSADGQSGAPADKKVEKIDPTKIDPALAQQILTDAFGSLKNIEQGNVIVLDKASFIAAWDAIYAPQKPWDPYVLTTYGGLEGFRYGDKQYINKDSRSVSLATVVHEMLHKNAAGDFLSSMGSAINEGVTELLSLEACTKAGFTTGNNSYPSQTGIVTALMGAGLDWDTIKSAYFQGGAQTKIAYWIGANCRGTWSEIYRLLEAGDFDAAKTKLRPKG